MYMGLVRVLRCVALAACALYARAHGLIAEPTPRNNKASTNYNEHSLSGGGVGVNYANGRNWPNGRWGVCGDPPDGPLVHEGGGGYEKHGGNVITRYKTGQVINVAFDIRVVHGGSYEMQLCPVPDGVSGAAERKYVTEACFRKMVVARFWQAPKAKPGIERYSFKLPQGFRAKYAVLRWFWTTANSCNPPGIPKNMIVSANMNTCGKGGSNPEVFINCANISVDDKGGPPGRVPKPNGTAVAGGGSVSQPAPVQGGPSSGGTSGGASPVAPAAPIAATASSGSGGFPIPVTALVFGVVAGSAGTMPLLLLGNAVLALAAGFACCVLVVLVATISSFEPYPTDDHDD